MKGREKALVTSGSGGRLFTPVHREQHGFLLTTAEVAAGLGVTPSTVRDHKKNHAADLVEGKHWCVEAFDASGPGQKKVYWTKQGIIRLADYINTDQAKRFKRKIEEQVVQAGEMVNALATPQQLLVMGNQLMLAAKELFNNQQVIKHRLEDIEQDVGTVDKRAGDAANLAREAQEEAAAALHEIREFKQQYLDEATRIKLRKTVRDRVHALARLFMETGMPAKLAYWNVWTVLFRKYGCDSLKAMNWLYYERAIAFLDQHVAWTRTRHRVPFEFWPENRDRIEEEPLFVETEGSRDRRTGQ